MIYLDNAATTPLDGDVFAAMKPYFTDIYANPQSQHAAGRAAAEGLISARDKTAEIFGCKAEEVYFLSGGTEAGNLAVKGACAARGKGHMIISGIEHPAVYSAAEDMRKMGFSLTVIPPDKEGFISPRDVERAIRPDTFFCAVMAVNNETGAIQDVDGISAVCARAGIFYYCDCVQAVGRTPFPTGKVSAFAVSAHKFYGPKGAAALYLKKGGVLSPLISGGMQERGLRAGTVNVAGAAGLAAALSKAVESRADCGAAERFLSRVFSGVEGVKLNGGSPRVTDIVNLSFEGCDGRSILVNLDLNGVCASTGAACSAGAVTPSRVIAAMAGEERARSAVRFSFGKYNTEAEADEAAEILKKIVKKLRG